MINVKQMSKIIVIGPDSKLKKTISALYDLNVLHIVEHKKDEIDIGQPMAEAEKLSEILVKVKSLISVLKPEATNTEKVKITERKILQLESEVNNKLDQLRTFSEKKANLNEKLKKLDEIISLNLNLDHLSDYDSIAWFLGYVDKIDEFKTKLEKLTKRSKVEHQKNLIAVFIEKSKEDQLRKLLNEHSFKAIDISILADLKGGIQKNIDYIAKSLAQIEKKKAMTERYLNLLSKDHGPSLLHKKTILEQEIEKAEAPLKFAKTESSFIVTGWVPKKKAQKTAYKLNQATKNKIYIRIEEPGEKESVPVELENPKPVKPFEFFMNLYTLPEYREIDPTFFISVTFPLLFGFMLGDFGYGIITLILFIMLKKKFPKIKNFFNILIYASIATIFFGLLFGEFFGFEELFHYELPRILSRAHQINELLIIAIAIGVIHINWGLIAGFFNELKSHGLKHAIYAKLSWIVLEIGVAVLALSYFTKIAIPPFAGYIILALSIIMLYLGEGVNGLVEIPGIFSNILSYARLMAIGLASVQLAIVVNEFTIEFFHSGGLMIIAGVFVLVIGHIINILLGLLGGFLHSLRLEYVEFFTKFFKGGAKRYVPFGLKTN